MGGILNSGLFLSWKTAERRGPPVDLSSFAHRTGIGHRGWHSLLQRHAEYKTHAPTVPVRTTGLSERASAAGKKSPRHRLFPCC
jgi:hypothetical protein